MGTVKFKILNDYGSLGGSDSTYFRFIDWNGFEKYDIRFVGILLVNQCRKPIAEGTKILAV